jgi:hypothetical protein
MDSYGWSRGSGGSLTAQEVGCDDGCAPANWHFATVVPLGFRRAVGSWVSYMRGLDRSSTSGLRKGEVQAEIQAFGSAEHAVSICSHLDHSLITLGKHSSRSSTDISQVKSCCADDGHGRNDESIIGPHVASRARTFPKTVNSLTDDLQLAKM